MPWKVTGLPASDPASTGTPARIAFAVCCSDPANAPAMVVAISPSPSIGASGDFGSSSDCMICGIARRRTSASAPCSASRFHAQSSTTSVGVKVIFFAAISAIVSSVRPRAVCSMPLAPASIASRTSASVPTCTVVRMRRDFASAIAARNTSSRSRGSGRAVESRFEHQLHDVDALAIELGDRGARRFGRLDLARQQLREPRQEREHLRSDARPSR